MRDFEESTASIDITLQTLFEISLTLKKNWFKIIKLTITSFFFVSVNHTKTPGKSVSVFVHKSTDIWESIKTPLHIGYACCDC